MKIEDLVALLNNRLKEFKLSRDYARMSGNLDRMNAADEEIIALEDTLFKLNLLIDSSKSEEVKAAMLGDLKDGSISVLDEYDITTYATDPKHEIKIMTILSKMPVMDTADKINDYIKRKYPGSPVTGEMIISGAEAYSVDIRLMMAIMEQDSSFGTAGIAVRTLNPGNVGNDDDGNIRSYSSWQEGVTAVAEWLSRHRGSTIIPQIVLDDIIGPTSSTTPGVATSTPGTSTTTPSTSTSTPSTTTSTTTSTSTSTPSSSGSSSSGTSTTTPIIFAPTPGTSTATPSTVNSSSTPSTSTTTQSSLGSSSSGTSTTTPSSSTSTPSSTSTTTTSSSTSSSETSSTDTSSNNSSSNSTPVTETSSTDTSVPEASSNNNSSESSSPESSSGGDASSSEASSSSSSSEASSANTSSESSSSNTITN